MQRAISKQPMPQKLATPGLYVSIDRKGQSLHAEKRKVLERNIQSSRQFRFARDWSSATMVGLLFFDDMYKMLARYTISGHNCVRACACIVFMALISTQILCVRSRNSLCQCQCVQNAIVSHLFDRYSHRRTTASYLGPEMHERMALSIVVPERSALRNNTQSWAAAYL